MLIPDLDQIIRFENGEMSREEATEFLTELRDTGALWHLQGFYQRAARDLGVI